MISDDPDEDATDLDDDAIFDTFVDSPSQALKSDTAIPLADWPSRTITEVELNLDTETLAWFKSAHIDWRQQMAFVLRAWVLANGIEGRTSSPNQKPILSLR